MNNISFYSLIFSQNSMSAQYIMRPSVFIKTTNPLYGLDAEKQLFFLPNYHFKDIPELPVHHDGDHHDWEHPQVVVLVPRIPKTYNMLGIN